MAGAGFVFLESALGHERLYDAVEFKKVLPKPISSELPTYPELARYAHIVGEVKL
jgi:hypothetical protein